MADEAHRRDTRKRGGNHADEVARGATKSGARIAFRDAISQASKGIRWMPRRSATKKDAVSCEKTWGAASRQRTMYLRMGQPAIRRDSIVKEEKPGELKHLSNRRKRNQMRFPK